MSLSRPFRRKWQALMDEIYEEQYGKLGSHRRIWWLKVTVYPKAARLLSEDERCSRCKLEWSNIEGAVNHVAGLLHFRLWCLEHPERAIERWGERVRLLIAEETLSEVKP